MISSVHRDEHKAENASKIKYDVNKGQCAKSFGFEKNKKRVKTIRLCEAISVLAIFPQKRRVTCYCKLTNVRFSLPLSKFNSSQTVFFNMLRPT